MDYLSVEHKAEISLDSEATWDVSWMSDFDIDFLHSDVITMHTKNFLKSRSEK